MKKPTGPDEITVEHDKLLRAAKLCAGVSDQRSPIIPYQSTLVRFDYEGCDLTANNGRVSIRATVALTPKGDLTSFCVNAKRFLEVVSRMPEGRLTLRPAPGVVTVSSGKGRASVKIMTTMADDFPKVDVPEFYPQVDRERLVTMFRRVAGVPDPILSSGLTCGIQIEATDTALSAWATNGKMLAETSRPIATGETIAPGRASIHVEAARDFLSALNADDPPWCGLLLGETSAVSCGRVTVMAKAAAWPAMNWRSNIPEAIQRVTCDRAELTSAVERASMFATSEKPNITLVTATAENGVRVSSANIAGTDGEASTLVETEGDRVAFQMSVSWRYLRDALNSIDTDRVELAMAGQFLPIVVRPVGEDGQLHLIAAMTK